jgi:ABC-2 type transport system permease protein
MSAAEVLVVASPPRARMSTRFLRSELKIIFGRRRNIAGLGVLAAVPVILAVSVRLSSGSQGGGPDFIIGITGNGLFVAFAALALELPLFLPLAVSAISGDSVAGEANLGTLRYLLAIPAGRTRLLVIKYAAIVIFAVAAGVEFAVPCGAVLGTRRDRIVRLDADRAADRRDHRDRAGECVDVRLRLDRAIGLAAPVAAHTLVDLVR